MAGTRVVFMGSPEFAVPSLHALVEGGYDIGGVFTQPDRPAGRGRKLIAAAVKVAAIELGLPVYQPPTLREAAARAALEQIAPDVIVVAAFGQILRPALLALPPRGCLNVHASLLPRHRGASAIAAAILAGDDVTGVSIMQMDRGLDTGPVVEQRSLLVAPTDTTGTLSHRLATLGAVLLAAVLPDWIAGRLMPWPQEDRQATMAPLLRKEAGVVAWTKPAFAIWREIRAYNPWPLSSSTLGAEPVQLLEAVSVPAERAGSQEWAPGGLVTPGAWLTAVPAGDRSRAGFAIMTGDGLLVPLVLRRAGRKAVTGAEFARGLHGLAGLRFS